MKRLAILRHAKSSWDQPGLQDFNRPLNERGWKAARRLGREMKRRRMHFDLVIASTAARARETIDGIEVHFQFGAEIRFDPAMYMADKQTLIELVQGLSEMVQAPLLVGHNPGLEELLILLSHADRKGLREKIVQKFPTAALAIIDLDVETWAEVAAGTGEIVDLIVPKALA